MMNEHLPNSITILLLENSTEGGGLLEHMLTEAGVACHEVHREAHFLDAVDHLTSNQVDLVLALLDPSDRKDVTAIHYLKQASQDVPIVVIVEGEDEDAASAALQAGAQEVLLKGLFPGKALKRVIHHAIERVTLSREKKILEEQFHKAQRMEAVGLMAGGIAHDFNSILSAIIGYTELALESSESQSDLRTDLEEIAAAGIRAQKLVAQMLMFSRQTKAAIGPVRIHLLTNEALNMLREVVPAAIDIQQEILSFGMIKGDPGQIYQIIKILCKNAIHAMRGTGGALKVRVQEAIIDKAIASKHSDLAPGAYMSLTVSENGVGLDEPTSNRFFKANFASTGNEKDAGLNLSMVYDYVKACCGRITVETQLEKGTCCTVLFPMLKEEEDSPESEEQNDPSSSEKFVVPFMDDEPAVIATA